MMILIEPSGRHMEQCSFVISLRNQVIRTGVRSVFVYILAITRNEADGGGYPFPFNNAGLS